MRFSSIRPQITQISQILTTKDTKGFTKDTKRVLNHRGRRGMKSVFRKSIPLGMHLSVENGASSLLSASHRDASATTRRLING